jgi:hypothetical protein
MAKREGAAFHEVFMTLDFLAFQATAIQGT